MADDNDQRKTRIAAIFGQGAAAYDRVGPRIFEYWGRRLVEIAQIPRGASVLDVATGTGAVLVPAAGRVEPLGHIIGVDLAEAMLQEASDSIRQLGLNQAEVRRMDAEHLEFPDGSFDYVLCGFGLSFFPHPDAALAEFARVLRPGGKVAMTPQLPATNWLPEELRERYQLRAQPQRGPDLADPAIVKAVMRQAGLVDVQVAEEDADFVFANEEDLFSWYWSLPMVSYGYFQDKGPDVVQRFKVDLFEELRSLKKPEGIHWRQRALVVLARKAD